MALTVEIRKRLGDFQLEVRLDSSGRLALLGGSGCGKSVTLRCIAGVLTPDEGRITLDGVPLYDSAARINLPPQKRQIGYLFQQYALFPNMTVRQNIGAAIRDRAGKAAVDTLLRRFQLEPVAHLRPGQISGGQQQRCALARILAARPRAILLDEPFSALDSYLRYQLEAELAETLDHFPGPVLWVSHDLGEVARNCPQVCVLDQGRSQPVQPMEALLHRPGTEAAARLAGCRTCVEAIPQDTGLLIPAWGLRLACVRPVPPETRCAGIREEQVRPAAPDAPNAISCRVLRAVRDLDRGVLLLSPLTAAEGAPPLRMAVAPESLPQLSGRAALTVSVAPEDILLLQ